jgi:hypothetical protein
MPTFLGSIKIHRAVKAKKHIYFNLLSEIWLAGEEYEV